MNNYLLSLFFFKSRKQHEEWEHDLDSCQPIKNNECSRGFYFLSSQSLVQSQSAMWREKSGRKTLFLISPSQHLEPPNNSLAADLTRQQPQQTPENTAAGPLGLHQQRDTTRRMTASCLFPRAAFPPLSWHTVMRSHNSLMANDANMKCKVSLIWPLLNS